MKAELAFGAETHPGPLSSSTLVLCSAASEAASSISQQCFVF